MKDNFINSSLASRHPGEISLYSIIVFFRSNIYLISLITLTSLVLGGFYALISPPVYQATSSIRIEVGTPTPSPNLPVSLAGLFEARSAAASEIEMIRTKIVLGDVVERLGLNLRAEPKRFPIFGRWVAKGSSSHHKPGLLGFGGYAWGNEYIKIKSFDVPEFFFGKTFVIKTKEDGFDLIFDDLNLISSQVGKDITFSSEHGNIHLIVSEISANPNTQFNLIKFSAESLIENLQKSLLVSDRGKQSGLIAISLTGTNPVLISNTVNEIAKSYIEQNINLKSEDTERSLAFLENKLPELKSTIELAEAKYSSFRNSRGTADVSEEVKATLNQSVQAKTRLDELRTRKAELSTRFQDANPVVNAIDQQIRSVSAQVADIDARLKRVPSTEQDLVRLSRDVKVNTELYASLLNTAQQLRLASASRVGSAKIIDTASVQSTPIGPKKLLLLIGSGVAGFIIAIISCFFRKALSLTVDDPDTLLSKTGIPVMAIIPHNLDSRVEKSRFFVEDSFKDGHVNKIQGKVFDSFRIFRSSLISNQTSGLEKIIGFTSGSSGVGKSFVAANFATVLALGGSRVLLINGEPRKNSFLGLTSTEKIDGINEILENSISIEQALSKDIVKGLDSICFKNLSNDSSDILAQRKFADLISEFSKLYDFIIINMPSVLSSADAIMYAKFTGLNLCVVRKKVSSLSEVNSVVNRYIQSGNKLHGFVFNDV